MKYFEPQIYVSHFSSDAVHTDDSITASSETYNDWTLQQEQAILIEKKRTQLDEIIKFKF